ncbi:hypothetical protein Mp_8g15370 [Marchantia polymorpha subsp. ruderalis]|uniref:Uncharacterized protein n=1 Tax=Marchantia polymorpha TaxID=3197 RepID=A0A2R6VZ40_MARPO|nr:hypothetical protein MARPO_0297s0002 [Marchantia polymorpha]BBN19974.1 hypothetical protein Mp_8g15370 [Marchantia polymorpha subsp. ruderalis]|eukprot:PTQ26869.1 hypothetical protein MARPO_0297s0002 [Marchantia polymorpha]
MVRVRLVSYSCKINKHPTYATHSDGGMWRSSSTHDEPVIEIRTTALDLGPAGVAVSHGLVVLVLVLLRGHLADGGQPANSSHGAQEALDRENHVRGPLQIFPRLVGAGGRGLELVLVLGRRLLVVAEVLELVAMERRALGRGRRVADSPLVQPVVRGLGLGLGLPRSPVRRLPHGAHQAARLVPRTPAGHSRVAAGLRGRLHAIALLLLLLLAQPHERAGHSALALHLLLGACSLACSTSSCCCCYPTSLPADRR